MNEKLLKQGTRVKFDVQTFSGMGTIVGVASTPQPVIGATYIIEPDEKLDSQVYKYSHFVAFENQLIII